MEASDNLNVFAVDVGYGNVKFTFGNSRQQGSKIECGIFPSRSPLASVTDLSAGLSQTRDTIQIQVNGKKYEIGKDAAISLGSFDESLVLDNKFCLSDAYMARLLGAIYFMNCGARDGGKQLKEIHIDCLVMGLPVSTFCDSDTRAKLVNKVVGIHELPNISVNVKETIILPQPAGAFYEFAFNNDMLDRLRTQTNLIVDVGFFTFDWLLCTGFKVVNSRSDSVNQGMYPVIRDVSELANRLEGWKAEKMVLMKQFEEHFRSGTPVNVYGKDRDITKYIHAGQPIMDQAVRNLVNSVGDGADIHNILVAGGGAKLFRQTIQEKFPHHNIIIMTDPVFSNVRGFQLAGEQQMLLRKFKSRKLVA